MRRYDGLLLGTVVVEWRYGSALTTTTTTTTSTTKWRLFNECFFTICTGSMSLDMTVSCGCPSDHRTPMWSVCACSAGDGTEAGRCGRRPSQLATASVVSVPASAAVNDDDASFTAATSNSKSTDADAGSASSHADNHLSVRLVLDASPDAFLTCHFADVWHVSERERERERSFQLITDAHMRFFILQPQTDAVR